MAVPRIRLELTGDRELRVALGRISPRRNPGLVAEAFGKIALIATRYSADKAIRRGGAAAPLPNKLTSRGGHGRRSIRINRSPLPRAIEWGSDLVYMRVHETGGTFRVPRHRVSSHSRSVAFGRRVERFTVPSHERGPYSVRFRARPWLEPGLDEAVRVGPQVIADVIEKRLRLA